MSGHDHLCSRYGFMEDRDPFRLKDRNNNFITCYKCSRSSAPRSDLEPLVQEEAGKSTSRRGPEPRKAKLSADAAIHSNQQRIISCDYCNLHWHLDCLDPPMSVMPSSLKKWMCPSHADHVMVGILASLPPAPASQPVKIFSRSVGA